VISLSSSASGLHDPSAQIIGARSFEIFNEQHLTLYGFLLDILLIRMQLSRDELEAAEDPMLSVARRSSFWAALARGDRHAASEAVHGISVPLVIEESFPFNSEVSGGGMEGTLGWKVDTGAGNVALATPKSVTDGWNVDRDVLMVELDTDNLCMASLDNKGNALDFRACMNRKNGLPRDRSSATVECMVTTHQDQPNKIPRVRLHHSDSIGVFAIMCPRSSATVAPKCFSRPLFELGKFPWSLLALDRHLILLEIKAKPRVLKFILEGYPGEETMWNVTMTSHSTPSRKLEPPPPYSSMTKLRQTAKASAAESPESRRLLAQAREEVFHAPGIDFLLRDQHISPPHYQLDAPVGLGGDGPPPTTNFGWESPADDDGVSMGGSVNTASSLGELSALTSGAVLAKVLNKCNELSKVIASLKLENNAKDASLSFTIRKMKLKTRRLEEALRAQEESGTGAGIGGLYDELRPNRPSTLSPSDRQSLAFEVMSQISIGRYALKSDIPPPSRPLDMSKYVTHNELHAFDYVDKQQLAASISTVNAGPSPLEARIEALELEVTEPGGAFARMEKTMQDLLTKKVGDSVSAGPYTFKDIALTEMWAATIDPTAQGLDVIKYFIDARQLLGSMNTSDKTVAQTLQEAADARKGGYNDTASAMVGVSFGIINPKNIFKQSNSDKHASQGGSFSCRRSLRMTCSKETWSSAH
jgi:hypothetical protein